MIELTIWPFDRLTSDLIDRFYTVKLNKILSIGISLGTNLPKKDIFSQKQN